MSSRRALLAGLGTVASASLAGCAGLLDGGERSTPDIDRSALAAAVPPVDLPVDPLPVALPESLVANHRERASALLDAVPERPAVPNAVVARRLERDRERAAERLTDGVDARGALDRLNGWRSIRRSAADLRGAYRAATGHDDAERVRLRRRVVRGGLAAFVSDLEYRARDPVEAVLVYAPIEELASDARRQIQPVFPYPDDPLSAVEAAGRAVGSVEDAVATFADARGVESAYTDAHSDLATHWVTLSEAAGRLDHSVARTLRPVEEYRRSGPDAFERDVSGTVAGRLFRMASTRARDGPDDVRDKRHAGEYARAVRQSARELVTAVVLKRVVEDVREDAIDDEVTRAAIVDAAARARDAFDALADATHPRLAAAIATTAANGYEGGRQYLGEQFYDPADALVAFEYAARSAAVAPQAADFVAERLAAAE